MSKMPAKKKSCFQITSVIQAQVGAGGAGADDAESLDDPDDPQAEGAEPAEAEACERNPGDEEAEASPGRQVGGAAGAPGSRFRVIKLDHGSGEPFRRGRWTCAEFYEREPEGGAGRTPEQPADRDSGLGASTATEADPATAPHLPEPAGEAGRAPGHGVAGHATLLQLYPGPSPPAHHVPNRAAALPPNLEFHAQRLSLPLKAPPEVNPALAVAPDLMEWAGVMASLGPAAAALQYSGLNPAAALGMGDAPGAGAGRRKSDAAAAVPEGAGLVHGGGVNSLFGIAIPVDGDEDRNPSTVFYRAFQPGAGPPSASGASMVAIDNKIEQAMDLVKSHLMYAVREEVEVLKEQIKELYERNSVLERENAVLKSLANSEQLSQLSAHTPPGAAPATPASHPAQQPSVSSA